MTSPVRKSIVYSLAVLLMASLSVWAQNGSSDDEEANRHLAIKGLVITSPYQPITPKERSEWMVNSTLGPESLMAGVLSSAISTATNEPAEYGPTWGGLGHRFGMRLTGVSTGNAIEAGLGAIWGEDPRYDRSRQSPFSSRVRNVVKLTFIARYHDGHLGPAYARLIAIPGNNVLSNTWRAHSETYAEDVALRTILGFLGRMAGNAFVEFWPDVHRRIFRTRAGSE